MKGRIKMNALIMEQSRQGKSKYGSGAPPPGKEADIRMHRKHGKTSFTEGTVNRSMVSLDMQNMDSNCDCL